MHSVTGSGARGAGRFTKVAAAFLAAPGLPFANVLWAERIERVFAKHGNLFGVNSIYSTVLTVEVAEQLQLQADPAWLWKGRHAKLIDGFTFTMPDTDAAIPKTLKLRADLTDQLRQTAFSLGV